MKLGMDDRFFPVLVNKNKVDDKVVTKDFAGDIAIVYAKYLGKNVNENISFAIATPTTEVNVDKMHAMAMENLLRSDLPETEVYLKPVAEMLRELMGDIMDMPDFNMTEGPQMFVLSNKMKIRGAGQILRPDLLLNFCIWHDTESVYIIPSSIHEFILVVMKDEDEENISQIIKEVNASEVSPEDFLSNYLYKYTLETNKITVVNETKKRK